MLANSRLLSFSCSVMTGASTEMVSRLTKLMSVARKMRPAIPQRRPLMPGGAGANGFPSVAKMRPTVAPGLLPVERAHRVDGGSAAGRQVARKDGDRGDAEGRQRHGRRIGGQDAEELRLHQTGCGIGGGASPRHSAPRTYQPFTTHQHATR